MHQKRNTGISIIILFQFPTFFDIETSSRRFNNWPVKGQKIHLFLEIQLFIHEQQTQWLRKTTFPAQFNCTVLGCAVVEKYLQKTVRPSFLEL